MDGAGDIASTLQSEIQREIAALKSPDIRLTSTERANTLAKLAGAAHTLAKVSGELDFGKRVLQSKEFKSVMEVLFESLKKHPEAAKDSADAIERWAESQIAQDVLDD